MRRFTLVAQFEAEEPVPEWLIGVDPHESNSVKGMCVFTQPVALLESQECYHVVPITEDGIVIAIRNAVSNTYFAATKDVIFAKAGTTLYARDKV